MLQMNRHPNLETRLSESWPNIIIYKPNSYPGPNRYLPKTNMDFWEEEYDKHGKCSDKTFNRHNTSFGLGTCGISTMYPLCFVNKLFYQAFNIVISTLNVSIQWQRPHLRCRKIEGVFYLWEVVICLDHDAKYPVNRNKTTNCGNWVQYWL